MGAGRNHFPGSLVVALCFGFPWLAGCKQSGAPSVPAPTPVASAPLVTASAEADERIAVAGMGMGTGMGMGMGTGMGTGAASAANGSSKLVKGIYTWGAEVETLSPCNTDKTYWLEGREELLAPLQDLAMKKADAANEAYQPIYVEAQIVYAGQATDGFAVDYDGVMQLQAVKIASGNVPSQCKLLDNSPGAAK